MVTSNLTEEMMKSGAQLVQKMDASGSGPDAACWFYDADADMWKFIIAEANVKKYGARSEYGRILELLRKYPGEFGTLSLDDISLITPNAHPVSVLRRVINTGSKITGIRFRKNVIDGVMIDDAYIYRMT